MKKYSLLFAWLIAIIGTLYSLYRSQILGHEPCIYCWYQRICLFPLTILLIAPLWRGDSTPIPYLIPLPILGGLIALLQVIQLSAERAPCSKLASCDLPFALMSVAGFILITLFMSLKK
ncbi:MAG: disulfide bond formation protein B [Simkaniaceae bacterium]|nr:disulfide bond formation protein B [Simkaniaceae bacterium]